MAKKSLFKTFSNLFTTGDSPAHGQNISATKAISMQNAYISHSCLNVQYSYPPYLEIIQQLSSSKPEVVNAAVYYLEKIAHNEPDYAEDLANDLKAYMKRVKLAADNKTAVQELIRVISE